MSDKTTTGYSRVLRGVAGASGAIALVIMSIYVERNFHIIENILQPPNNRIEGKLRGWKHPQTGQPCTLDCLPRVMRVSEHEDRLEVEIQNNAFPLNNVAFFVQFSENAILKTQGAYMGGSGEKIQIYYGRGHVTDFQYIDTCTYAEIDGRGFMWATGYAIGDISSRANNVSRIREMKTEDAQTAEICLQRAQ